MVLVVVLLIQIRIVSTASLWAFKRLWVENVPRLCLCQVNNCVGVC